MAASPVALVTFVFFKEEAALFAVDTVGVFDSVVLAGVGSGKVPGAALLYKFELIAELLLSVVPEEYEAEEGSCVSSIS